MKKMGYSFRIKDRVEIENCEEDEEVGGSYTEARILKALGEDKYRVEYTDRFDDNDSPLTEEVSGEFIRPVPPKVVHKKNFNEDDKVDYYESPGWWPGTVSVKNNRSSYHITSDRDGELIEDVKPTFMRVHCEWQRRTFSWDFSNPNEEIKQPSSKRMRTCGPEGHYNFNQENSDITGSEESTSASRPQDNENPPITSASESSSSSTQDSNADDESNSASSTEDGDDGSNSHADESNSVSSTQDGSDSADNDDSAAPPSKLQQNKIWEMRK